MQKDLLLTVLSTELLAQNIQQINVRHVKEQIKNEELSDVVQNQLKPDKICDSDGLLTGVLKLLPINWLLLPLFIFNTLFITCYYPVSWTTSKYALYKRFGYEL